MDFTKAFNELKSVKELLSAVVISEETMKQVATLGDTLNSLNKTKEAMEAEIGRVKVSLEAEKKKHDSTVATLNSDLEKKSAELEMLKREISSGRKGFAVEAEAHAAAIASSKKEHAAILSEMNKESLVAKDRLESIRKTIQKFSEI